MNVHINNNDYELDVIKLQKMAFLYNALEKGWNVSKKNDLYIFKKNLGTFLCQHFILTNVDKFSSKKFCKICL